MSTQPGAEGLPDRSQLRVGTAEREQVAQILAKAHGEGRLADDEYLDRAASAMSAVTYADLDTLLTDLPVGGGSLVPDSQSRSPAPPVGPVEYRHARRQRRRDEGLKGAWLAWAIASAVNLIIWALVSLSAAEFVYFWPMWVMGPWGAVLLAITLFARNE